MYIPIIYMERLARLELMRTVLLPLEVNLPYQVSARDATHPTSGSYPFTKILDSARGIPK